MLRTGTSESVYSITVAPHTAMLITCTSIAESCNKGHLSYLLHNLLCCDSNRNTVRSPKPTQQQLGTGSRVVISLLLTAAFSSLMPYSPMTCSFNALALSMAAEQACVLCWRLQEARAGSHCGFHNTRMAFVQPSPDFPFALLREVRQGSALGLACRKPRVGRGKPPARCPSETRFAPLSPSHRTIALPLQLYTGVCLLASPPPRAPPEHDYRPFPATFRVRHSGSHLPRHITFPGPSS